MKKLLIFTLVAFSLGACKKEQSEAVPEKVPQPEMYTTMPSAATAYLDAYFTNTYTFGESVTTISEDSISYEVVEVILDGETRARGYIALKGDSEDFVYFVDVDRDALTMFTEEIATNTTSSFTDIHLMEEYSATNEFDFIAAISNANDGIAPGDDTPDPEFRAKRKFWGKGDAPLYYLGPCMGGSRIGVYQVWAFWLKNGTKEVNEPC